MSSEEMIKYLNHPYRLNEHTLSELRVVLRKYPYFHTAHMLFLLNLRNINDPRYREFLKQSAVFIKDRDKFLRLINRLYVPKEGEDSNHADAKEPSDSLETAKQKEEASGKTLPETSPETAGEGTQGKHIKETRKDKDFSTEYLRSRISETLSEQKGDADEKSSKTPELGNDFFIIDKVSQVEEKMVRRLREESKQGEKPEQSGRGQSFAEKDRFELERNDSADEEDQTGSRQGLKEEGKPAGKNEKGREEDGTRQKTGPQQKGDPSEDAGNASGSREEEPSKAKIRLNFGGEYFTEQDYKKRKEDSRKQQNDLIEQFIRKAPEMESITPSDKENKDISQSSIQEKEDIASEKLIKVYLQQGYYQKALQAYEKLSLKYPEKSDYFAEQIKKIKQNINQQKK